MSANVLQQIEWWLPLGSICARRVLPVTCYACVADRYGLLARGAWLLSLGALVGGYVILAGGPDLLLLVTGIWTVYFSIVSALMYFVMEPISRWRLASPARFALSVGLFWIVPLVLAEARRGPPRSDSHRLIAPASNFAERAIRQIAERELPRGVFVLPTGLVLDPMKSWTHLPSAVLVAALVSCGHEDAPVGDASVEDGSAPREHDAGERAEGGLDARVASKADAGVDAAAPGTDASMDASKDAVVSGDSGMDSSVDAGSDVGILDDAGEDPKTCETTDGDAGFESSESVVFQVPVGGGALRVCTATGVVVLTFAASAAGQVVEAQAVDPHTQAWQNAAFADALSDAIVLKPDGQVFADPVKVLLPSASILGFVFDPAGGVPTPLRMSKDWTTLDLTRFGTLGIVDPQHSCQESAGGQFTNAWKEEPESGFCSGYPSRSLSRYYACGGIAFCHQIQVGCCVEPGASGVECTVDNAGPIHSFARANPTPGYEYCKGVGDTPFVESASPTAVIANSTDQEVFLTGNNFHPDGKVIGGIDLYGDGSLITESTWISSTLVRVLLRGFELDQPGTVYLGYANRAADGSLDYARASNGFPVPLTP